MASENCISLSGFANMLCIRFGAVCTIYQVWQICTINAKPVFHIRYVPGLAGLVQDWQVWQICVPPTYIP